MASLISWAKGLFNYTEIQDDHRSSSEATEATPINRRVASIASYSIDRSPPPPPAPLLSNEEKEIYPLKNSGGQKSRKSSDTKKESPRLID